MDRDADKDADKDGNIRNDAPGRRRFVARSLALALYVAAPGLRAAGNRQARFTIACLHSSNMLPNLLVQLRAALAAQSPALAERITFVEEFAGFDSARLAPLARKLVAQSPDLIVCFDLNATQAVLAARADLRLPVVFRAHDDPHAQGIIDSYAHPGRNVTGITTYRCVDHKMVELLHDAFPTVRRIGFVFDASQNDGGCHAQSHAYAQSQGIELVDFNVGSNAALPAALDRIGAARLGAMIVPASAPSWTQRKLVIARMNALAIPAIYEGEVFVEDGGLMHFGAIVDDTFERMARDIVKILHGENAGNIPVSQPTRFELVINMKAEGARKYRLSPRVLRRADRIIE
jgi:putative tryptophan/tyrosine transport system substrate-binding protein